jgi:phosphonopyruvate decarboxylase
MSAAQTQLNPADLYQSLIKNGVTYFCGVPDSLLSPFGFYLEDRAKDSHDSAVNEGSALAMAIGYYLATENVPLVYMQNSGLGNAINPLISLADPLVLGIPMLLLIGWRGQPGKTDEPQHKKQGLITDKLLAALDIPYEVLSSSTKVSGQIARAVRRAKQSNGPAALLVESGTFLPYKSKLRENAYSLSREQVVGDIADSLSNIDIVVATTGKASREFFEHRETKRQPHNDLLVVGGMGHASVIALAVAKQKSNRKVYCIDGDGALLMHMGSLATIGNSSPSNLYHFVINNGSHESVGGQPTVGLGIDIPAIAKACGYKHTYSVTDRDALKMTLMKIKRLKGPVLVEVRVKLSSRADLIRPTIHPAKNKSEFIAHLKDT